MSNQELLVFAIYELAETFGVDMSDARKELYCEALQDIDPQAIRAACKQLAKTEPNWFPLPGKIRQTALIDPNRQSAEEGWDYVCGRISRYGFNGGLGPVSEEIKAGVDACGGWWGICRSERPDRNRFQFIQAFNQRRERLDRNVLARDGASQQMPDELIEAMKQIGRGDNEI